MASPVIRIGEDGSSIWEFGGGSPPPPEPEFNDYLLFLSRVESGMPSNLFSEKNLRANPENLPARRCTEAYIGGGYIMEGGMRDGLVTFFHASAPLVPVASLNFYEWDLSGAQIWGVGAIYVEEENKIYMHFWYSYWDPRAYQNIPELVVRCVTPGMEDYQGFPPCTQDELVASYRIQLQDIVEVVMHPSGKMSAVTFNTQINCDYFSVVLSGGLRLTPTYDQTYISLVNLSRSDDAEWFNSAAWMKRTAGSGVFLLAYEYSREGDYRTADLVLYDIVAGDTSEAISTITYFGIDRLETSYLTPLATLAGGAVDKLATVVVHRETEQAIILHADLSEIDFYEFDFMDVLQAGVIDPELNSSIEFNGGYMIYWHASEQAVCLSAMDYSEGSWGTPCVSIVSLNGVVENLPNLWWGDRTYANGVQSYRMSSPIPLDDRFCQFD